jgi:imidazolonepropionase
VTLVAHAAARVVTCDPLRASANDLLGVIERGAILIEGQRIKWVGARSELPPDAAVIDHGDVVLTPGLIDAHTHACWSGSRHGEYAVRMAGGDYEAIAQAGGGIVSTHRAVAQASGRSLVSDLSRRLRRMASLGVTTVEVKSGYGLEPDLERKQLRAIRETALDLSLPHVVPTFLGLHALPPASRAHRVDYVRRVADELVPEVAEQGLAQFVDAYVDRDAFQVSEARIVFEAARRASLGIRVHAGQFHDVGGAELAAEFGAASVDHVEHIGLEGIARLAASKVPAVLLPIASFTLVQPPPPIAEMRAAGVQLVVASDANPGTAPTESLPLAMAFAVRAYGLSPAEAILATTRYAAASLHRFGEHVGTRVPRGALVAGCAADFVIWRLPHEYAIIQPWGVSKTRLVVRDGRVLYDGASDATG